MKTTLLKIAAAAAGITLALCISAGAVLWYKSRPKPPKPWNTTAISRADISRVRAVGEGEDTRILLHFHARNTTSNDYAVPATNNLKVMARFNDGALSRPLDTFIEVYGPWLIPSNETGTLSLSVRGFKPVPQKSGQSDDDYDDQLRALLDSKLSSIVGFVVFDEGDRYQINLPSWGRTKPTDDKTKKQ